MKTRLIAWLRRWGLIGPETMVRWLHLRPISGGEGEFDLGSFAGEVGSFLGGGGGEGLPSVSLPSNWSGMDLGLTGAPDTSSWFDKLSGYAEKALPFVKGGLGLAQIPLQIKAMQDAASQRGTLNKSIETAQKVSAPAAAGAAQIVPAAVSAELGGPLPPEAEADIANKVNTYRTQQLDALVRQGMDPQTARAQIESAVGQYENQLRVAWMNQLIGAGSSLTNAALGGSTVAANIAGGEQRTTDTALLEANKALERLLGMTG